MTFSTPALLASGGHEVSEPAALLVRRLSRRAHLGGRSSVEATIQAMFARRQLEHGDCLSQRTLRERHTTQLRKFGFGAAFGGAGLEAETAGDAGTCNPKRPVLILRVANLP